jgi:hypothetical protein
MSQAEEIAKAKAKIAKLLNMTVENGCSEDEQETAMSMAAGIATKLGIDLEAQRQSEPTAAQRKAIKKAFAQEFKIHQILAFQAAGKLYGCEVYTYSGGKGGCFFIGREENVELAEQTAFWLMRQVELLYKEHLPRGLSQTVRAQYRKTFKAACAHRVYERAATLMREMRYNNQSAQQATGQNALVVQGYFEQLEKENADFFKPAPEVQARIEERQKQYAEEEERRRAALTVQEREREDREAERYLKKLMKRKGPRARRLPTGIGTNAGLAAGDRVQLRKGLK